MLFGIFCDEFRIQRRVNRHELLLLSRYNSFLRYKKTRMSIGLIRRPNLHFRSILLRQRVRRTCGMVTSVVRGHTVETFKLEYASGRCVGPGRCPATIFVWGFTVEYVKVEYFADEDQKTAVLYFVSSSTSGRASSRSQQCPYTEWTRRWAPYQCSYLPNGLLSLPL